jgi:hypothetical protein
MTIAWNKVTWYSKFAAVIVFVGTFFLGFWLGTMNAEKVYIEIPPAIQHSVEEATLISSTSGTIFTNHDGGYSIMVPPNWTSEAGKNGSTMLRPKDKLPNSSKEYVADIFINVIPNPNHDNLINFYKRADINLFDVAETHTSLSVNGLDAVLFEHIPGMLMSTIVSINGTGNIFEITDYDEGHQSDGVFDAIVSSFTPVR